MSIDISKKFQDLLLAFSQAEDLKERQRIENELWDEYGTERAVFVLDMSGFSMLTRKYGIVITSPWSNACKRPPSPLSNRMVGA